MSISEQIIMIGMVVLGTVITRFLPFVVFSSGNQPPAYVRYLGRMLPSAALGLLVIYCLKDVSWLAGNHGFPQLSAIAAVVALHLWKRQMLLSIAGGTIFYMLLVQLVLPAAQ